MCHRTVWRKELENRSASPSVVFQMFEAGVENFFHPMQLHSLSVATFVQPLTHCIETSVDGVEMPIDNPKVGAKEGCNEADQSGVEEHRNSDRDVELLVRHTYWSALMDPTRLASYAAMAGSCCSM